MDFSLIYYKFIQFIEWFQAHPIVGFLVGGILLFIGTNSDGHVEAGNTFLVILACLIIFATLISMLNF